MIRALWPEACKGKMSKADLVESRNNIARKLREPGGMASQLADSDAESSYHSDDDDFSSAKLSFFSECA